MRGIQALSEHRFQQPTRKTQGLVELRTQEQDPNRNSDSVTFKAVTEVSDFAFQAPRKKIHISLGIVPQTNTNSTAITPTPPPPKKSSF